MIQYEGMKAEESGNKGNRQLPAGAYVAKVMGARVIGDKPDQQLEIMFDIAEGLYANFYMNKYTAAKEHGSNYEIKYKGLMRLRIPNPDNKKAMYPESDIRRFNDMIYRFEKSNDGFHWDGDESRLADLLVGISVQEDEFNGSKYTKPVRFEVVQDVRQGLIKTMEPRRRDNGNPTNGPKMDQKSGMMKVDTVPLPWEDKPY